MVLVVDRPLLLTGTAFQYWLGDREHRLLDPAQEAIRIEPGELVIAALDPRPLLIGAPTAIEEVDPTYRYGVWRAEGRPRCPPRPWSRRTSASWAGPDPGRQEPRPAAGRGSCAGWARRRGR